MGRTTKVVEALSGRDLLDRLPAEVVSTPAGEVRVHGLGALDMVDIAPRARAIADEDEAGQMRMMVEIVARGLDLSTDEAGRLSLSVLSPLFAAVSRLSGLDEKAVADAVDHLKALPNDES